MFHALEVCFVKEKVSLLHLEIAVLDGIVVELLSQQCRSQMEDCVQLAPTALREYLHQIYVIQECTATLKDWLYQVVSVLQDTSVHLDPTLLHLTMTQ